MNLETDKNNKLISLIFSFKNEEENIEALVKRSHHSLIKITGWNYEMVFVNDDSNDTSLEKLLILQKNYNIRIINMSRTFGVFPCILAGFRNAKGDCIIYMDADLQDPPELIPELFNKYLKGNEVVHTVRTKRHGETLVKKIVSKIGYKIINSFSEINLPIESGDFKLISRKALKFILQQKEYRPYVRGLSVWVGFQQGYVEYEREGRHKGKTKMGTFSKGSILEFINGITSFSLKPLYLGIILGFAAMLFSIVLIIYAFFAKFFNLSVPGSSGIIIAVSFFSGILLTNIGIIGIYVARIFEQVKGRSQYIIKDIKDFKTTKE